jgi:hypothetical protein
MPKFGRRSKNSGPGVPEPKSVAWNPSKLGVLGLRRYLALSSGTTHSGGSPRTIRWMLSNALRKRAT